MSADTKHDVFLSFCHQDEPAARQLFSEMTSHGLTVFWSEEHMKEKAAGKEFPEPLYQTLKDSRHLVVVASTHMPKSRWVPLECEHFHSRYYVADPSNRGIYVLASNGTSATHIPRILHKFQRLRSNDEMVAALVKDNLDRLRKTNLELDAKVHHEQRRVEEAFNHYRYSRFWRPVLKRHDVHIFTCARDTRYDASMARGRGGRTTIDKWDYQTVLDITRFFASHYPDVKITIEDPVSKLPYGDIKRPGTHLRLALMIEKLKNKDCIIIGSPDVSDFAELVIAQVHNIDAYTESRVKTKGFVHIKAQQQSPSCGYWTRREREKEGVARIDGPEQFSTYAAESNDRSGTAYGILVVANNPFVDPGQKNKIVILSGFTGIATNGIAKFITDDKYLNEFHKLDRAYVDSDTAFEALIGTRFAFLDGDINARDARVIDTSGKGISFKELVEI
jgi:hypothetical protein